MQREAAKKLAKTIGIWIPSVLLMMIFVPQGWSKLFDDSGWARAFRHWGYPDWFRTTIGVVELTAVTLLLLGRTAAFGALLVIVVMLGGMATHLVFDGGRHMTSEIVPLALGTIVLVLRRSQLRDVAKWVRIGS